MSSILSNTDRENLSQGKVKLGGAIDAGFSVSVSDLNIPVNASPILNDFATLKVLDSISNEILLSKELDPTAFDLDGDGKIIFNIGK